MSLTKTSVNTAIKVLTEMIASKKEGLKVLQKEKKDVEKVKLQIVDLVAVNSLLLKELKAIDKPKKDCKGKSNCKCSK